MELRHRDPPSSIRVTLVSPGLVKTEFAEVKLGDKQKAEELYANAPHLEAEDVASAVIYALSAPPRVDVNDVLVQDTLHPLSCPICHRILTKENRCAPLAKRANSLE